MSADAGAAGDRVPVYGLIARDGVLVGPARWTVNRFGAEFGNLAWQISADYEDGADRPVSVHTVIRRRVPSATGDQWACAGVPEAKGLVAGELRAPVEDILNLPDRRRVAGHRSRGRLGGGVGVGGDRAGRPRRRA